MEQRAILKVELVGDNKLTLSRRGTWTGRAILSVLGAVVLMIYKEMVKYGMPKDEAKQYIKKCVSEAFDGEGVDKNE